MSEEKKNKRNRKIESFDILPEKLLDPEMDEALRRELIQEADDLEAKLNSDPELVGVGASEDLFASIVGKLKEQGVWEADEEEATEEETSFEADAEKSSEAYAKKKAAVPEIPAEVSVEKESRETAPLSADTRAGDDLEKLYQMLPEEDRKALELGRQVQEQGKKKAHKLKKRRKVYRFAGAAAAMLVLVCGVGMSTEANRKVALQAWNAVMENFGFRTATNSVDGQMVARSKSKEEAEAYAEISEKLGIGGIDFAYMPSGVEFLNFDCSNGSWEANLFYSYKDSVFNIKLINAKEEGVSYFSTDSSTKKVDTVKNMQNVEIEIWETNLDISDKEMPTYIVEAEYNGCRCMIYGKINIEEIKKIAKEMFFL